MPPNVLRKIIAQGIILAIVLPIWYFARTTGGLDKRSDHPMLLVRIFTDLVELCFAMELLLVLIILSTNLVSFCNILGTGPFPYFYDSYGIKYPNSTLLRNCQPSWMKLQISKYTSLNGTWTQYIWTDNSLKFI